MKIYGIIPSRFGSSRFPGKPIHVIAGKPLVAWVVEAVKRARRLDDVVVATDDERIVKAVEECGFISTVREVHRGAEIDFFLSERHAAYLLTAGISFLHGTMHNNKEFSILTLHANKTIAVLECRKTCIVAVFQ